MNAAAEIRRNPVVNKHHQIQPEYGHDEQADAGRTAELVTRDQILRRKWRQGSINFPCSANNTSRIGNLNRLILLLLYVMTVVYAHFIPIMDVGKRGA